MTARQAPRPAGLRLWVKLAAFGVLAVVATHAIHLYLATRITTAALAREQEALGHGIARLVAGEAVEPVLTGDAVALDRLMVRAAGEPHVAYAFVVREGRVLASSFPGPTPAGLVALGEGDRTHPVVVVDGGRRVLDLAEPILAGDAGVLRLGVDMSALQSTRRAIARPLGIIATVAVLLAVALAAWAGRRMARPIDEIIAAADRFDPAVEAPPVRPRGSAELASLAERFNEMTARLRAAHQEQERVRQKALATERLATLGSLVAGVAHEVNNPLSAMKGAVALLRAGGGDREQQEQDLALLDRAIDQLAGTVGRLLDFGRPKAPDVEPISVHRLAREAAELATMSLKRRGISVDELEEPGFDDAPVAADRKQVGQALLNLVLNAAYVTPDHGQIRLRLRRGGGFRGIAVEDDGPGIPEEVRARIFEPFFTTKPNGEGTGLGLSVARTVADRHHGALEFDFPEQGGTVATLWLPAAAHPDGASTPR